VEMEGVVALKDGDAMSAWVVAAVAFMFAMVDLRLRSRRAPRASLVPLTDQGSVANPSSRVCPMSSSGIRRGVCWIISVKELWR
jgi:hypothetical protein